MMPLSLFLSAALSSSPTPAQYPRAAVSVVVRWRDPSAAAASATCEHPSPPRWLLVQRGNEPNKGAWSLPGGKIRLGEGTLDAAKRELWEETRLAASKDHLGEVATACELKWHAGGPFACSDAIHDAGAAAGFHYVISQCFAEATAATMPVAVAADDALDVRWWSAEDVHAAEANGAVTRGVGKVLERSELLYSTGFLDCT